VERDTKGHAGNLRKVNERTDGCIVRADGSGTSVGAEPIGQSV